MAPFDREKWLKRARARLSRRGEEDRASALKAHAEDYLAIDGLRVTTEWARSKDIIVDFIKVQSGRFHSQSRRIEVSAHMAPVLQLYILLHELGHFLIEDEGPTYVADRFPNGYRRIMDDVPGRGPLHKVDVIAEEFDAWSRGLTLAKHLGIEVDRQVFDDVRARYLVSYFKWATRRGRVSDG